MSIGGVGGYAAFGYLEFGSVGSRSELGQRMMMLLRFESGTWRKGLYGSQPKGVRASIDKKAGKLQNYRSVCRSVDGRGPLGAVAQGGRSTFGGHHVVLLAPNLVNRPDVCDVIA